MTSSPYTRRLISSSHNMPACHHSQCKGIDVQYQAMVDIRDTTEAHTDIVNVLLSINDTYTVASLYDIGKLTVIKMAQKKVYRYLKLVM